MDFKDIVKNGYNQTAKEYLDARTIDSEDVCVLADFVELLSPNTIGLDAGCGAGIPITRKLAEEFDVTGVEFSERQIELAKQNVPNAKFFCADLTDRHFPENYFNGICSHYVIIHIPREEHRVLLSKFHCMLNTGGIALLWLGAQHPIDDIDDNHLGTKMYGRHFDSMTYIDILKEIGFHLTWSKFVKDETCEGSGHLFVLAQKK